jgi:hypothetical protein
LPATLNRGTQRWLLRRGTVTNADTGNRHLHNKLRNSAVLIAKYDPPFLAPLSAAVVPTTGITIIPVADAVHISILSFGARAGGRIVKSPRALAGTGATKCVAAAIAPGRIAIVGPRRV